MKRSWCTWRRANWVLTAAIVGINCYILLKPVYPVVELWVTKWRGQTTAQIPYKTNLQNEGDKNEKRKDPPADNRIVIPEIALDEHIFTGASESLVHKGVWARPLGSTPDKGGNTVLVGHRFTYNGPATFYHLDKVPVGAVMIVYWQGKEYDYKVEEVREVPPTEVSVEDNTPDDRLTVYTCTPLITAKNRLVLIAKPIEGATP